MNFKQTPQTNPANTTRTQHSAPLPPCALTPSPLHLWLPAPALFSHSNILCMRNKCDAQWAKRNCNLASPRGWDFLHFDFFGRPRKLWKATSCVRIPRVFPLPLFICMQTSTPLSHTHTHIDHALVICKAFVNANCAQLQQQPTKCANKPDKQLHVIPHTHMNRVYVFSHTYGQFAWLPISVTQHSSISHWFVIVCLTSSLSLFLSLTLSCCHLPSASKAINCNNSR